MTEPLAFIPPGGGEIIGDTPQRRVEFLSDHDSVHATLSRFGPGQEGAGLHVHRLHTDFFYVLEGEVTVRLGVQDEQVAVPAGTLARVPPLVVHGFRNASDAEMRYVNLHAPGSGFADYMRGLRDGRRVVYDQYDPPADGGRPTTEAVVGGAEVVADGVELLADVEAIRITRVRGATALRAEERVTSFYVLEGELVLTADGDEIRAPAGSWLQVRPGVAHEVADGASYLRLLS